MGRGKEISWLEASGFTHEEVTQALAEVDDEDEAFALLKRRRDKELEAPPAKRRRGFEIDGYWCTADASRSVWTSETLWGEPIRLVLPDLDLDGPVVGRRPTACLKLFGRMEAAASKLSWSDGGPLLCPKFGMAAVYDGGGSFYAPHRDNEKGFGQRPWVNFRSLTAVIYVNPCGFEKAEEGGQLRCFHHCRPTDLTGATARKVEDELMERMGPWLSMQK
eukprot:g15397.t1